MHRDLEAGTSKGHTLEKYPTASSQLSSDRDNGNETGPLGKIYRAVVFACRGSVLLLYYCYR